LPPFCALLAQGAKILTREIRLRPTYAVKFYADPSLFAEVFRENPILSKNILRCHAYAWQRTTRKAVDGINRRQCHARTGFSKLSFIFSQNEHFSPSVVCRLSSVTFVRPTQAVQIFGNISTALGTLAIHW